MQYVSEEIRIALIAAITGLFAGMLPLPFRFILDLFLKRDEMRVKYRHARALKQYELLLEHKLELARGARNPDIAEMKTAIARLERAVFGA